MDRTQDPMIDIVQDVFLMALVAWREARGEPREGKLAVCCTITNRVARPKWWGNDVPTVVFKKWQYSSMTDPNDPQLKLLPTPFEPAGWKQWRECLECAIEAYFSHRTHPAPGADSYFATYIPTPKWATPDKYVRTIGRHAFYDLDDDYERPVVKDAPSAA